jgi:hypothetical protein
LSFNLLLAYIPSIQHLLIAFCARQVLSLPALTQLTCLKLITTRGERKGELEEALSQLTGLRSLHVEVEGDEGDEAVTALQVAVVKQ